MRTTFPTPDGGNRGSIVEAIDKGVCEGSEDNQEEIDVNLAANPEKITEVSVDDIRYGVTDITNLRAIQTMLRVESDRDNPRSEAMKRLKEKRREVKSD